MKIIIFISLYDIWSYYFTYNTVAKLIVGLDQGFFLFLTSIQKLINCRAKS